MIGNQGCGVLAIGLCGKATGKQGFGVHAVGLEADSRKQIHVGVLRVQSRMLSRIFPGYGKNRDSVTNGCATGH